MNLTFVLIEPKVPGNIGAAARALKTMGFNNLYLVNPCEYLEGEALWLAHGSRDVLESIQTFHDFSSAIQDFDLVIGTTANEKRSAKADYLPPDVLAQLISKKQGSINTIAVVFGREESGMTNAELKLCDLVSSIPLKTNYPSLNLSQAVMLYAYELSKVNFEETSVPVSEKGNFTTVKDKISILMKEIGMDDGSNLYNRVLERVSFMNSGDINLVLSLLTRIQKKIHQ